MNRSFDARRLIPQSRRAYLCYATALIAVLAALGYWKAIALNPQERALVGTWFYYHPLLADANETAIVRFERSRRYTIQSESNTVSALEINPRWEANEEGVTYTEGTVWQRLSAKVGWGNLEGNFCRIVEMTDEYVILDSDESAWVGLFVLGRIDDPDDTAQVRRVQQKCVELWEATYSESHGQH